MPVSRPPGDTPSGDSPSQVRTEGFLNNTSLEQRPARSEDIVDRPGAGGPVDAEGPAVAGYEILGPLGEGGMGVVYKARQVALNRVVALKVILHAEYAGAEQRRRFRAEAEAIAALQHPNVVQVYEVGESCGLPYFSLEYCSGGSLAARLNGTPLPAVEAARLVETLARAVHAAHRAGVVHRDLKPANVLLLEDGTPKVGDFGLAKRLDQQGQTHTGDVLGTPAYMSPEQAAGKKDVGPAADVYALGALLYELLTGRPPFQAATVLETLQLVVSQDPVRVRYLQPGMPRDLETICLTCLHKDPRRRYPSAQEVGEELQRFLAGQPIRARPSGLAERAGRWARRNPGVAGLSAAVLLLMAAGTVGSTVAAVRIAASRNEAQERAREADCARQDAERALTRAEDLAEESRRRLVRLQAANGVRLMDEGDLLGALPWFAEALRLERGPAQEETHRIRLGAILRRCPRPAHVWFHEAPLTCAVFSSDGRFIVTASGNPVDEKEPGEARVWEVESGRARTPPLRQRRAITAAAFSPDGRQVVTAGYDRTAQVWDVATGQALGGPLEHPGPVNAVCYSRDGRLLVTCSGDVFAPDSKGAALVWDAAERRLVASLPHPYPVNEAAFSPDGRRLVTAGGTPFGACGKGEAWVWDVASGDGLLTLAHRGAVLCAAFSPNGRRIVTASEDGSARVWDADTGLAVGQPLRHRNHVTFAAFSPDGSRVLTTSRDGTARVWEAATGTPLTAPIKHQATVRQGAFSSDGRWAITASSDRTARVWDTATGEMILPPLWHGGKIIAASFSPDGRRVLTAGLDQMTRLWDLFPEAATVLLKHGGGVNQAAFSPDGRLVVTACADQAARLWDAGSGRQVGPPLRHRGPVQCACFSPDGARVATASQDGSAAVWEIATGRPVLLPQGGPLVCAAFNPEGSWLVTASEDGSARVWEAATGRPVGQPLRHRGPVRDASFDPAGRRVLTAGDDRTARVWEAETGKPLLVITHRAGVTAAAFSPDGRRIVTACSDFSLAERAGQVWDAQSGEPLTPPLLHADGVLHAAFSRDGRWVVTASEDATARIWEAATGKPTGPVLKHRSHVIHAEFSPDSRRVLTSSRDGTARVWDVATGEPLAPPLRHAGFVTHAAFSPRDGFRVVTASADGTASIWELASEKRSLDDLIPLASFLAGHRVEDTSGFVPLAPAELRRGWRAVQHGSSPGE